MSSIRTNIIIAGELIGAAQSSLLVNDDGQFCILTANQLLIVTLVAGIEADASFQSDRLDTKGKQKQNNTDDEANWQARLDNNHFVTTIPVDRKHTIGWAGYCFDYRSVLTSGTGDAWWKAVSFSPTGVGRLGGCVLAALTTNDEVLVFEPSKNAHRGKWDETADITSTLARSLLADVAPSYDTDDNERAAFMAGVGLRVEQCRATAVAWSGSASTVHDYSMLAVGHRSGDVTLWRRTPAGHMDLLRTFRAAPGATRIATLAWSSLQVSANGVQGQIAVADSAGHVWSVPVSRSLPAESTSTSPWPEHLDEALQSSGSIEVGNPVCLVDGGPSATQLLWIGSSKDDALALAYARIGSIGIVSLRSASEGVLAVATVEEVDLPCVGAEDWVGATELAPCCGLQYDPAAGVVHVALTSGGFYDLHWSAHQSPTIDAKASEALSARLIANSTLLRRRVNQEVAHALRTRMDVPARMEGMRVGGVHHWAGTDLIAYTYQRFRPEALTYEAAYQRTVVLVVGSKGTDVDFPSALSIALNDGLSASRTTVRRLQPFLVHLREHPTDIAAVTSLATVLLGSPPSAPQAPKPGQGPAAMLHDEVLHHQRLSSFRLVGWLLRALARSLEVPLDMQPQVLELEALIRGAVEQFVAQHIASILSEHQAGLSLEEKQVLARLEYFKRQTSADASAATSAMDEPCPACQANIPFNDLRTAICLNSHVWQRCAVTLSLLTGSDVRTCSSCLRKVQQTFPPVKFDSTQPTPQDPRCIKAILNAATCCLHCGGRWIVQL